MASPGNRHCVNCIGALSFPIDLFLTDWLQTQRTGSHSSEHVYSDGTAYVGIRELQLIASCERSVGLHVFRTLEFRPVQFA